MRDNIKNIQKQNEEINKIILKTLNNSGIKNIFQQYQQLLDDFNLPLLQIKKFLKNIERIKDTISFHVPEIDSIENISHVFQDYLTNINKNTQILLEYGWCFSYDTEANKLIEFGELFENGDIDIANEKIHKYYRNKTSHIFKVLSERHINRKQIFKDIEKGYEYGLYSLCIPTMISQIDGICNDVLGTKYFLSNRDTQVSYAIEKLREELIDSFMISILVPRNFLNTNEKYIHKYKIKLNRHEILHGVDFVYGTEINTLRIISILLLISEILFNYKKKLSC